MEGFPLRMPLNALIGSSGRGSMTALSSTSLKATFCPGFIPSFFLISAGITICPLEEVLTIFISFTFILVFYLLKV